MATPQEFSNHGSREHWLAEAMQSRLIQQTLSCCECGTEAAQRPSTVGLSELGAPHSSDLDLSLARHGYCVRCNALGIPWRRLNSGVDVTA